MVLPSSSSSSWWTPHHLYALGTSLTMRTPIISGARMAGIEPSTLINPCCCFFSFAKKGFSPSNTKRKYIGLEDSSTPGTNGELKFLSFAPLFGLSASKCPFVSGLNEPQVSCVQDGEWLPWWSASSSLTNPKPFYCIDDRTASMLTHAIVFKSPHWD